MYSVRHLVSVVCLATFSLTVSHSCLVTGEHLLGDVVTHLARGGNIVADLLGDLLADWPGDGGTLAVGHLLGLGLGDQRANSPGLVLAVTDGDLLARLPV